MEVLAGLGLLATELFKYNKENYEFDQDQRFEREECRLKMQVERFQLFREDIRDLVELTVGKMDLYHLVGALFLKMIVFYYCVGFFTKEPPPFLLALYYLSNCCAWVYLMLAIWLAMHASISSHSYGTRLLTRFVRLPIPGSAQLNVLNARYADFEKQGVQMWRVPFLDKKANAWRQRNAEGNLTTEGPRRMTSAELLEVQRQGALPGRSPAPTAAGAGGKGNGKTAAATAAPAGVAPAEPGAGGEDWLGSGEYAYGGSDDMAGREAEMLRAVEFRTHRHVQLFRQLQSQWQCFDAYARVSMSLGVRQMIQSLTYYLLGICMVDQQTPFVAYVLVVCLQALATSIGVLDIHGLPCYGNLDLSIAGAAPTIIAAIQLSVAERNPDDGLLNSDNVYHVALAAFPLEICWFHLLLWAASPTDDENALPRHFRSVLFMDVFSEVDDPAELDVKTGQRKLNPEERDQLLRKADAAEVSLREAHAALRRWEVVPRNWQSREQHKVLKQAGRELDFWVEALVRELQLRRLPQLSADLEERRNFDQLTTAEREEDPFTGSLLGPFGHNTGAGLESKYYYDPENNEYIYEPLPSDRLVLTLGILVDAVRGFVAEVEAVCMASGHAVREKAAEAAMQSAVAEEDDTAENTPLARARTQSNYNKTPGAAGDRTPKLRPNRLPWQLLCCLTRAIQLVWAYAFVISILRVTGVYLCDWQYLASPHEGEAAGAKPGGEAKGEPAAQGGEGRRLGATGWTLWQEEVEWPGGSFFRPESLWCLPPGAGNVRGVAIGSPFAAYAAHVGQGVPTRRWLEELSPASIPPGSVAICGPSDVQAGSAAFPTSCWMGVPSTEGLVLQPLLGGQLREHRTLQFLGERWRLVAGALVPCAAADTAAGSGAEAGGASCLLLVGWDGGEQLPVSLVPLADAGLSEASIAPLLHLPLLPAGAGREGVMPAQAAGSRAAAAAVEAPALHLEPGGGRLWVLAARGDLVAWDLLPGPPTLVGRWQPRWPAGLDIRDFRGAALCRDEATGDLLVAGRGSGGPALVRGPAPTSPAGAAA